MTDARAAIDIAAPLDTVWALLARVSDYPAFDPNCVRILGGGAEHGARLQVYSTLEPERPFRATVTTFRPPRLMIWSGSRFLGQLRRERKFTLSPIPGGGSRFQIEERFFGRLAGMTQRSQPDMSEAFRQFSEGLKELAEAMAVGRGR